ncbi:helix-turn-helix transcriptional regulator [Streptomyces triculaminicus]|uniref:Helix-turn-helix transcriptional regulator n=2 Tax=Streptomyces TaxID=1883 RepID=A0A939JQ78_9ACTN|nr:MULTISPECIES: helix-turn-helix transcriptional regulator [Streptomyces]MBO0652980.1 helix-turn-helix transcriptional regulator [Streptomyces triculaminicus]QSY51471.1 helix-turn-helix transcriptional regulator [Streptomyces griseocarneus]
MPAPKELDPSTSLTALYGAKLRKLRMRSSMTQRELGDKIPIAHSRIAQFELGKEMPTKAVSERLDVLLGADGDLSDLWEHARRTPFPNWAQKFVEYEARASAMHKYMAHVVPGLLQTEAYAREVLRLGQPWRAADEIEEQVVARLNRQAILAREDPPLLWVVLDEAVLRRPIGGSAAMYEQLARVREAAEAPNIEVQVMPFEAGAHSALGGSLTLLSFRSGPDVAYLEGDHHSELVEDSAATARHSHRYDLVHASALSPTASTAWLERAMEDFSTCRKIVPT